MRRGQCLSPLTATALIAMMTYQELSDLGEPKRWGKNPVSVHVFLNFALYPFKYPFNSLK